MILSFKLCGMFGHDECCVVCNFSQRDRKMHSQIFQIPSLPPNVSWYFDWHLLTCAHQSNALSMVSLPTLPEHPLCPNQPHFMSTHLFEHSTRVEGEKQESFKKTLKGTNAYAVLTLTRMIPKKILILKGKK